MTSVLIHIMDQRASQSRRQLPSETSYSNSKYSSITMLKKIYCCRNGRVKYFNNMHSYSQLVLLSWGYTSTPPDNYMDFVRLETTINN